MSQYQDFGLEPPSRPEATVAKVAMIAFAKSWR